MSLPSRIHIIFSLALSAFCAAPANGATIMSLAIQNASVGANGSGEIAVNITGVGELINLAGYEFRITPAGGATSQLQFLEESEAFLSDSAYLFAGNSAAANDAVPSSGGTVSTSLLPNDTFVGGDGTDDLSDVAVAGAKLLVRLAVKHSAGPADPLSTVGHTFNVSLVPASGDSTAFAGGAANTGFIDSAFAGVGYTSQSGTVTIIVPEPVGWIASTSSLLSLAFLLERVRRPASRFLGRGTRIHWQNAVMVLKIDTPHFAIAL